MNDPFYFTVPIELDGERADKVVSTLIDELSRSAAQQLINDGSVTLNGAVPVKSRAVRVGETLQVILPDPKRLTLAPEDIPLDIRYEDNDLLVVNKPKGMVVHPATGHYTGTLVSALINHCGDSLSGINGVIRPGIVHRIDKDTSGLLIVAKNDFAHRALAAQIKEHSFKREYRAVVCGSIREDSGTIDRPIGRSEKDRKKQAVGVKNARQAVTHYEVLERLRGYTYVRLTLETGRTHQIRVHMAYRGNPVAGDVVYGGAKNVCGLFGQCLHAGLIGFRHPRDGRYIEVVSELPAYFEDFLKKLR